MVRGLTCTHHFTVRGLPRTLSHLAARSHSLPSPKGNSRLLYLGVISDILALSLGRFAPARSKPQQSRSVSLVFRASTDSCLLPQGRLLPPLPPVSAAGASLLPVQVRKGIGRSLLPPLPLQVAR